MLQVTMAWNLQIQVALEFLEYVLQRRRRRNSRLNGEAQAMRLPGTVIRILPEYHDPHLLQWRRVQRVEDQRTRRIDDLPRRFFTAQKIAELPHVGLFEFIAQGAFPAVFEFDAITLIHGATLVCRGADPKESSATSQCESRRHPGTADDMKMSPTAHLHDRARLYDQ